MHPRASPPSVRRWTFTTGCQLAAVFAAAAIAARAACIAPPHETGNERPAHGKGGNVLLVITGFPIPLHRFSVAPISHLPHANGDATFTRERRYVARESPKNLPDDGQGEPADDGHLRVIIVNFGTNRAPASRGRRSVSATPWGLSLRTSSRHGRLDTRGWVLPGLPIVRKSEESRRVTRPHDPRIMPWLPRRAR
jgi:hypothetical protein